MLSFLTANWEWCLIALYVLEKAIKLAIDKAPNVYRLRIRRLIENELNKNN